MAERIANIWLKVCFLISAERSVTMQAMFDRKPKLSWCLVLVRVDTGLYRTFPGWWRELPHTRTRNSSRLCDIPQSSCHTRLPPDSSLKGTSSVFALSLSELIRNRNRKLPEWSEVWARDLTLGRLFRIQKSYIGKVDSSTSNFK